MRGDGRIFLLKNSKVFHCAFYLHGEEQRETTHEIDPTKALKFLKTRLKQLYADQAGGPTFVTTRASKLTVTELAEALKADFQLRGKLSSQNASHLRRMIADFGEYRAVALTAEKIDRYIQQRLDAGDRPATINRTTQLLGQSYALAIQRGHLNKAPHVRKLSEKGNVRKGFLNPADFQKVLAALPDDLKDFCEWGYATGMRKGETTLLRWDMIEGDELRIPGNITKNRESRTLPLCGELAEIIERRRALRMVNENGTARMVDFIFHRDGMPVGEFRKSWKTACTKASVKGTRYHDLRRSAARNLSQAGVPREHAKKVTGHVSDSMWDRYNIVITDDVRKALERAEEYRKAAGEKIVSITNR